MFEGKSKRPAVVQQKVTRLWRRIAVEWVVPKVKTISGGLEPLPSSLIQGESWHFTYL